MKLTEKVRQKVILDILDGKYSPGDKLPTERDMAVITQTSRITVRRAYEQLERNGVIVRKPKLGTRIASSFKGNQQEIDEVGVIATVRNQFSRDFIESVHDTCMDNDAMINLALAHDSAGQTEMAIKLVTRGIRNIIIWGFDRDLDFSTFERIRALGVNIVFFDRVIPGPFADYVGLDNQDAIVSIMDDAIKECAEKFIYVDITDMNVDSNNERKEYFLKECQKRGLEHSMFSVPWHPKDKLLPTNICHDFLAKEKCSGNTAMICVNDTIALSVIGACPRNMPVYGVDGSPDALQAGIISYRQPVIEMAAAAVKALEDQQKKGEKWKARKIRFKGGLLKE